MNSKSNKGQPQSPYVYQRQKGNPGRDQIQNAGNVVISNQAYPVDLISSELKDAAFGNEKTGKNSRLPTDIFISHWSGESPLASLLTRWIGELFQERLTVFSTSEFDAIRVGDRWLESIENSLKTAKIAFIILSRSSLERHWVNFEIGFAWGRGIPVSFLCHSDLDHKSLPHPYSARQALDMQNKGFPKQFLKHIADHFGLVSQEKIKFDELEQQLSQTLHEIK